MLTRWLLKFVVGLMLVSVGLLPSMAQEDMPPLPGELVLGDLGAPRGLAFDANGNLLVAVAGTGGEVETLLPGPEGEAITRLGMTGRVVSVAPDGTTSDLIAGFPSYAAPMETTGLYRAIPRGNSLWVVFSGSGPITMGSFWLDTIAEIDMTTLATVRLINLNHYEMVNDPDGRGYDSNVADIAWNADGTLYIVDAGMNALLSWTEADGLATVQTWGNDVPTAIEIAEDGSFYIGFLGEGIAPGAGKIEHWAEGALIETFSGLTAVTDILLAGDTLYAVQLFLFGEQGPGPGNVVAVSTDGVIPVAEGIPAPFALAMGDDGALYVSFGTLAFTPGMTGGVIRLTN
jgi:hypothetical protein